MTSVNDFLKVPEPRKSVFDAGIERTPIGNALDWKWGMGVRLRKKKGAQWQGKVVGFYSTELTPIGYAIESEREKGSVQIYPESALEEVHNS